ncbi:MAG: oligosaccharide flippase family protein [Saprospiraceae bacterium]|nr:oligosaccharide flippase family protein [Saprospiraceae bacterium]
MPHSPLQTAYRKGLRWSFIGSAGSGMLQFAQIALFARLAGPEAAGDYALAATFVSFLTPVAEAGLSQAVVQAASVHPRQLATLAWVNMGLGLLLLTGLALAGPFLGQWFGRADLQGLLLLMGASLVVTPFGAQYAGLMARELRFDQSARIEIVSWLVSFMYTVLMAWRGGGAWAIAGGFLLRNIVATLGCVWAGRTIMAVPWRAPGGFREAGALLRFGAYELSSRWADFFSNYLDKLIVAKWLGAEALGYYHLAFSFLLLPTARIGYVVTRVAFPLIARVRDDHAQLQAFYERPAKEVVLLLFPLYTGLVLFAEEITRIGFGDQWLPAAPLMIAFGIAGLVRSLCAPFPQLVKGLGKPQYWLWWMLVFSAVLCLTLAVFLHFSPDVVSAAWSRTAAKYCFELAMLGWLARLCGVKMAPVLRFAGKTLFILLVLSLLTLLAEHITRLLWLKALVFGGGVLVLWVRAWKR